MLLQRCKISHSYCLKEHVYDDMRRMDFEFDLESVALLSFYTSVIK